MENAGGGKSSNLAGIFFLNHGGGDHVITLFPFIRINKHEALKHRPKKLTKGILVIILIVL
jgi:hypothetical protein